MKRLPGPAQQGRGVGVAHPQLQEELAVVAEYRVGFRQGGARLKRDLVQGQSRAVTLKLQTLGRKCLISLVHDEAPSIRVSRERIGPSQLPRGPKPPSSRQ